MTTPIRVPVISREPVASTLRVLQLEEEGADSFTAHSLPQIRRVYGGQVVAQALLAAQATIADPARLPHSLHAYFLRGGDSAEPFRLDVERLRDGRSFSNRRITCRQGERAILVEEASFQVPEVGLEHLISAPDAPSPQTLSADLEILRTTDNPVGRFLGRQLAFDVRHVQPQLYTRSDASRVDHQQLWMSPRSPLSPDTPQSVHRALLAYASDQVMLEPALRTLGLSWITPGLSLASLDHAMWFHRDVDMNAWLLFDGRCSSAQGGRAKADVRIFSEDGELLATASQEGMIRVPDTEHRGSGRWSFGVHSQAEARRIQSQAREALTGRAAGPLSGGSDAGA